MQFIMSHDLIIIFHLSIVYSLDCTVILVQPNLIPKHYIKATDT